MKKNSENKNKLNLKNNKENITNFNYYFIFKISSIY